MKTVGDLQIPDAHRFFYGEAGQVREDERIIQATAECMGGGPIGRIFDGVFCRLGLVPTRASEPGRSSNPGMWAELLQRMPFPYRIPCRS